MTCYSKDSGRSSVRSEKECIVVGVKVIGAKLETNDKDVAVEV